MRFPQDLATLFDLLYNNKIPHSDEILAIFKRQKINNMIPALLPSDTIVAHKTGDWAPIYHDGGIVYKPNDPFVLTVFTNSNDPSDVAQLARVAYYRTSQVVGESAEPEPTQKVSAASSVDHIYLAQLPQISNVLGAQTDAATGERIYTVQPGDTLWSIAADQYGSGYDYVNIISRNNISNPSGLSSGTILYLPPIPGTTFTPAEQSPQLNAADLGVTENDLKIGPAQTKTVGNALLLPGAPLYVVKQWVENQAVAAAPTSDAKINALLSLSQARLSEVKSELVLGNVSAVQPLLAQSETALSQATAIAKTATNNDVALYKIKQQRDVHFGVLAEAGISVPVSEKDTYINAVYSFYEKQKQDVQPVIASAPATSPLQQTPIIGTVSQVQNNIATVKQANGTTSQVLLTNLTPSRSINDTTSTENATSVQPGETIAVVGSVTPQSVVTPQFILQNVPAQLPVGHRGTVLEINPKDQTIKLQDTTGKIDTIVINNNTVVKSTDTDVNIGGITAGSTITVVGNTVTPVTPTPTTVPTEVQNASGSGVTQPTQTPTANPTGEEPTGEPTMPVNDQSQSTIVLNATPTIASAPPASNSGTTTTSTLSTANAKGTPTGVTLKTTPTPTLTNAKITPTSATLKTTPGVTVKVTVTTVPVATKTVVTPVPTVKSTTSVPNIPTTGQTVTATTVTVVQNASGKNETFSPPPPTPAKTTAPAPVAPAPAPAKAAPPPAPPAAAPPPKAAAPAPAVTTKK